MGSEIGSQVNVMFTQGDGGVLLCRIKGRVGFIHHDYAGKLPRPGEYWRIEIAGFSPKKGDPTKGTYFVKPRAYLSDSGPRRVTEYHGLIESVTEDKEIYQDCLAALRCGAVQPTRPALVEWLHDRAWEHERLRKTAAARAEKARGLLRCWGFKILREIAAPSGDFTFITHEQYRGFWASGGEGKALVLLTSPTTGYVLTDTAACWYKSSDEALDTLPPKLDGLDGLIWWEGYNTLFVGLYEW